VGTWIKDITYVGEISKIGSLILRSINIALVSNYSLSLKPVVLSRQQQARLQKKFK